MVAGAQEWAQICSETFVPLQAKTVDPDFSAGLSHLDLTATVGITGVRSTRSEVFRHERDITRHPRDGFLVAVHGEGRGSVDQNGRRVVMARGDATIYDTETPYTLGFPGFMSETVLQVPRRVLDPRGVRSSTVTARLLACSNPALAALRALVAATIDAPPTSPVEGELVAEAAVNLVKVSLALAQRDFDGAPAPASSRLALAARLTTYVDAHHTDARLTPETLARAHHVSLRSAQAVLAEAGQTPAGVIRSKRLEHARRLLQAGERVDQVTYLSGFSDVGTFTRAFKREAGETPSSFRLRLAGSTAS
jgi:AraC-like DNA-binding protein